MNSQGAHDELASRYGKEPVTRTAAEWLWALLPIGGSVFCLSALVYYHLHHDELAVASTLQVLIAGLYRFLGFAPAFLFFLLLLSWSSIWFVVGRIDRPMGRLLRLAAMTVMLGVLMNLGESGAEPAFRKGELGAWLAEHMVASFGYYPSLVMVWAVTFGALLLATDYFFSEYFERLRPSEAPADDGVEAAVTDHLKQLATVPGPASSEVLPDPAVADAAPNHAAPPVAVVADDAEVVVEPDVDVPIEPAAYRPRRRSYFERRQSETASESGPGRVDESWVPTGPDAQEIENPEIGAGVVPPADESAGEAVAVDVGAQFHAPVAVPEPEPVDEGMAETVAEAVVEAVAAPELAPPPAPVVPDSPAAEPAAVEAFADEAEQAAAIEPPAIEPEVAAEASVDDEPIVPIPRPEVVPERVRQERVVAAPREPELPRDREAVRQQVLFGPNLDDALVAEAVEVVTTWRRASATFLQRKLRIDYELACRVLAELGRRGIVELEADATHGRVLG